MFGWAFGWNRSILSFTECRMLNWKSTNHWYDTAAMGFEAVEFYLILLLNCFSFSLLLSGFLLSTPNRSHCSAQEQVLCVLLLMRVIYVWCLDDILHAILCNGALTIYMRTKRFSSSKGYSNGVLYVYIYSTISKKIQRIKWKAGKRKMWWDPYAQTAD